MSTASRGRAREYQVRDHMAAQGWRPIMRAAASKGSADLLLAHPEHGAALVQVGVGSKFLSFNDRTRFFHDAELCGALAILATVVPVPGKPTIFRYWRVTLGTASTWEQWRP